MATIPAFLVGSIDPPLSASDVVVIATKAQAAGQIIVDLAAAGAAAGLGSPAIVCCTNGVSVERTALRHFDRVFGVMVEMPGTQCANPQPSPSIPPARIKLTTTGALSQPDSRRDVLPPLCSPRFPSCRPLPPRHRRAVRVHR